MEKITEFKDEYRFLSNFYACKIEYKGLVYPHAEGAFQAQKCATDEAKIKYTQMNNPVIAKRKGKVEPGFPADWDEKALGIMKEILRAKFSDPALREKLLATKDAELIEGNRWHDNRWGHCTCDRCREKPYLNLLGRILMEIRDEIKTE